MSLLAISEEPITSDFIASSINCNAVLVRKEISLLKKAGLIDTQEGKHGGVKIVVDPYSIDLDQLYKITYGNADLFSNNKNEPNPLCLVGRNIHTLMKKINADAEMSLMEKLHETTIGNLVSSFKK